MAPFRSALLLCGCVMAAAAGAQPLSRHAPAEGPAILLAGGCHSDVRRHFVPEFGRTLPHFHRGDCSPVRAGSATVPADCHRDAREHWIPGMGLVYHRHVGDSCQVRVIRRSKVPAPG